MRFAICECSSYTCICVASVIVTFALFNLTVLSSLRTGFYGLVLCTHVLFAFDFCYGNMSLIVNSFRYAFVVQ